MMTIILMKPTTEGMNATSVFQGEEVKCLAGRVLLLGKMKNNC